MDQHVKRVKSQLTWSPRLRPASHALDPFSTLVMNIPWPRSNPPRMEKCSISSRVVLVKVTVLTLALAAQAMFSRLIWPIMRCNKYIFHLCQQVFLFPCILIIYYSFINWFLIYLFIHLFASLPEKNACNTKRNNFSWELLFKIMKYTCHYWVQ